MQLKENYIETHLREWREREQRDEGLFSPATLKSPKFLKAKLAHFDSISQRYERQGNRDRIGLALLKVEQNNVLRQLYPNFIVRLAVKGFRAWSVSQNRKLAAKQNDNSLRELKQDMNRMGFGKYFPSAARMIAQGQREFSIPASYYVTEKERLDFQINVAVDNSDNHRLHSFKAALSNESQRQSVKQQLYTFEHGRGYNIQQATNLLFGRAVYTEGSGWQQLDFNDKDAQGNYRLKNFPDQFGFDSEKHVSALPLKDSSQIKEIKAKLENGDQIEVLLMVKNKEHKVKIEANPQKREISFFNEKDQKISLSDLEPAKKVRLSIQKADVSLQQQKNIVEGGKGKSMGI